MNLIIYYKPNSNQTELLEFLKSRTDMNVFIAQTKLDVLNYFQKLNEVEQLVIMDITIPTDLGLIQYIKTNFSSTRILVYASPLIRQSIEIIKENEIELLDGSIEELKKIHTKIIDSNKNNRESK